MREGGRATLAVVALLVTTLAGAGALASPDPTAQCAVAKIAAAGRRGTQDLTCRATAARRNSPVDASCVARAENRLATSYARAEQGGACLVTGDAGATETLVAAFVADVVAQIPPGASDTERQCAARKLRATGRKVRGEAKCQGAALAAGTTVDAECIAHVEARFDAAFARADAAGACAGAAATVEGSVDNLMAQLVVSATTPCAGTPFGICNGACGDGGVCAPDLGTSVCACFLPTTPCGGTFPVCNGECAGGTCRQTGTIPFGACTCAPPGTLCTDGPFPTCGGACSGTDSCFPARAPLLGGTDDVCSCGSSAPCGSGGLACPAGFVCTVFPGSTQSCLPL